MLDTATVKVRRRWTMRRQRVHYVAILDELRDLVAAELGLTPAEVLRLEAELHAPVWARRRTAIVFVRVSFLPRK